MQVEVIDTPELGDRSYVVHDGRVAVVIDPQRDLDRIHEPLDRLGLRVCLVCETHRHNDYVTGGYALSQDCGAQYVIPREEDVRCARTAVVDGDILDAGDLRIEVLATPGHSPGHVAYLVHAPDGTIAAFTGGSLLFGTVGRPDLVEASRADSWARAQYGSVRRLAARLPDSTAIFPTHGFGSYCAAGGTVRLDDSTIGEQRRDNVALARTSEDAFVDELLAGLRPYPAYYRHVGTINRACPAAADLTPGSRISADELRRRATEREWVVDLRDRPAFAAGHLQGAINVPLGTNFATYLGWIVPQGERITLMAEQEEVVAAAQRQLARIDIERPEAAISPVAELIGDQRRRYPCVRFTDVAATAPPPQVLDVRRPDERAMSGVRGSMHVPFYEVLDRLADVPQTELWVHCAGGYRASVAASLLARDGRDVVLIDDKYEAAVEIGLVDSDDDATAR